MPKPRPSPEQRLAAAIRTTRQARGQTQRAAAAQGGTAPLTWLAAEKGEKRPRDFTLGAIERSLDWPTGTAKAILKGAEPPPATPPAPHTSALNLPEDRLARIETKLDAIAQHLNVKYKDDHGA